MEALIVISLLSIAMMAFAKGSWSSATHVRNTHFADKAILAGQDMVEILSVIDIQELESTEPGEPVAFGSQKIIYDIVDSMDENNNGDVNNDGIPDFRTIAINVYHSDDDDLSRDKLRVKNYYRRHTY